MLDDVVATELERARCRERLEHLSESSLDCDSLRREALRELQRVIGFDRWCWPFADSETLLPLSGWVFPRKAMVLGGLSDVLESFPIDVGE